jgi:mono/diheme cytochrome c family protein
MLRRIGAILAIAMAVLAGCSNSSDSPTQADSTPTDTTLVGDAVRGEEIFRVGVNNAPPCLTCHRTAVNSSGLGLGPNLDGIAERAAGRIEGMIAEDYLRDSILDPEDFEISGFIVSMYPDYGTDLSAQDLADLIAFLMTL